MTRALNAKTRPAKITRSLKRRLEIRCDPRVFEALSKLGLLLTEKGDVDKALSVFRKSLDLASGDLLVQNNSKWH